MINARLSDFHAMSVLIRLRVDGETRVSSLIESKAEINDQEIRGDVSGIVSEFRIGNDPLMVNTKLRRHQ